MDVAVVQEILKQSYLKGAFQAFLLTASRQGETVETLAAAVGVSKRTMYRYLAKIRKARLADRRNPHVELVSKPVADMYPCEHTDAFYIGRKRVCLRCMASNLEHDLRLQRLNAKGEEEREKPKPAEFRPKGSKKKQAVA